MTGKRKIIAITATFTAEPLENFLAFWMKELDIEYQIEFSPYNQVFQQLLDSSSLVLQNKDGVNVILIRMEDWFGTIDGSQIDIKARNFRDQVTRNMADLSQALQSTSMQSLSTIVCFCPPSVQTSADKSLGAFFDQQEEWLLSRLFSNSTIYVIKSSELTIRYPVKKYDDPYQNKLGHIPYTLSFFAALGTMIARKIYAILSQAYKVIVLDCDQTLWKGVCGEDGALGIEIDPPHKALQEFVVAQHNAGMLICLCSKNVEEDVDDVFERRPEMVLKRDHIVARRINWGFKSANIRSLAEELNLGLNSFIFIDDNPLECAEVKMNCPEVFTIQLPSETENIPRFISHIWAFDHIKITKEDQKRTALYQENIKREQFRFSTGTLDSFIEGLELKVRIDPMKQSQLPRVSQLTHRTNQFNFTTVRRSESDIQQMLQSGRYQCLVADVSDRFGDYGLVGVVIFRTEAKLLSVDTFLLSCRALGRGCEHQLVARLGQIAATDHLDYVELSYLPTKKNLPAIDFLNNIAAPYKHQTVDGVAFKIPTAFACEVKYKPGGNLASADQNLASKKNQKSSQTPTLHSRHETLVRIAADLYSTDLIESAMTRHRQRSRPMMDTEYEPPRTTLERILTTIWQDTLDIEPIGRQDNFFTLGGHSLLLTQLISRVRDNFQIEVSMTQFFTAPTIDGLTQLLTHGSHTAVDVNRVADLIAHIGRLSEQEAKSLLENEAGNDLDNLAELLRPYNDEAIKPISTAVKPGEHYRVASIRSIALSESSVLAYSRMSRISMQLTKNQRVILDLCQDFKSVVEHIQTLRKTGVTATESVLNEQFKKLVDQGFLISQRDLLSRFDKTQADPNPEIATMGMLTCNRLDDFQQNLSTYIDNSREFEKQIDFVVMDDSVATKTRSHYRQILESMRKQKQTPIYYAGLEEKQQFATDLAKEGKIPQKVLDFALFGDADSKKTPGANRNALLLHTVAETAFSADDDTICQPTLAPNLRKGLRVDSGTDPSDYWIYPDIESALDTQNTASIDLFGQHENMLGQSLSRIFLNSDQDIQFDTLTENMLDRLLTGSGRVYATFNGLIGDCGWGAPFGFWGSPMGYLLFSGDSHKRLVQSEQTYRAALTSRNIRRVVDRPAVTDHSFGMTTFFGFDNRDILPPFVPVSRGQDLLFVMAIHTCLPDSFFGHLPFSLGHRPIEKRSFWTNEVFRTASGFDTAKLLIECIDSCQFRADQKTGMERIHTLGRHLTSLGTLSPDDFDEFIRLRYWQRSHIFSQQAIRYMESRPDALPVWKKDVMKYIDLLTQSIARPDFFIPLDLVGDSDIELARHRAQRLVTEYGDLLTWWPDIVQTAKTLRVRGKRLGIAV